MTYLIGIALGVIATWLGICAVIVVAVLRSKAHDEAWEDERPEWERPPLPQRVRVDTSFAAHPSAVRIADLIAANEAARIDAEWEAMNS